MNGPFPALSRGSTRILQINLGYRCNQSCKHCHVGAGPQRTESMDRATVEEVLELLAKDRFSTLDLTGGAPEIHPDFREIVTVARGYGIEVLDRCNLTVLEEPGQEDLAEFLARRRVTIVASMPCYLEANVDAQRGAGVYRASLRGLRRLNALGYGKPGSGRVLNLVYNPAGDALPPAQTELEAAYKVRLREENGIVFDRLLTLTNMPIERFRRHLEANGRLDAYLSLLRGAHRPENVEAVMCRSLISVDWRGIVYDCDFNQMLDLPAALDGGAPVHVSRLAEIELAGKPIRVAEHCFGCTAGQGSSCGGALG